MRAIFIGRSSDGTHLSPVRRRAKTPRHRLLILGAAALSATLWAYACGDGTTEPTPPPPDPPRATSLTVTPATAQLTALGATVQLTAEVRDQNGNVMAGAAVTWSSGDGAVATVSATGLVTAVANGTATITATAGSASGSAAVTVAQEVSAVAVTPVAATLVAGDTLRLTAEAADANAHPVAGTEFEWASSDTLVAVVDGAGLVTGFGAGEVEVTATAAGVTGHAALTVVAPVPTAASVIPDTVALTALGQTAQLAAEVRDQIGRVMEGVVVSWSSADTTIAVVDSAGLVSAVGSGTTAVAATAGEATGEAVVRVMQSAGSVVVSPSADMIAPADTLRLVAEAFDENGHPVAGAEFRWTSSDVSVATVDASGLVRGVLEGMATITAAVGEASGTSEITVENPDRAALVALYEATDGPNWINSENWLTDAPLGEWFGVETNREGRVVTLAMSYWDSQTEQWVSNGVSGPIPPELGNLANLERLYLHENDLTGPIPTELGRLANLERLYLHENDLTGPIPTELGRLANLERLFLHENDLTGPIPTELGRLANLERLFLHENDLTGPIPTELGRLANLERLFLHENDLTGPIPTELGRLTDLEVLYLGGNDLTGPIPTELGRLTDLEALSLGSNDLTGLIPPELGELASLTWLSLRNNDLTGPIPRSLLDLARLTRFYFRGNEGLCAPGVAGFADWLGAMEDTSGPYCNESDVGVLNLLYETSGGPDWTNSSRWLETPALDEWYGVTADALGRVVTLDLSRNGLAGGLPGNLGFLAHVTELRIADNPDLSGRLPLSLVDLSLRALHYAGTELCAPVDTSYRNWLSAIPSHEGTGAECGPLSDREILEIFYEATGGPNWIHSQNWRTDAPLGEWYGVEVDDQGRVDELRFLANGLAGWIPRELGGLANLRSLYLYRDDLTSSIPPELGNLAKLERLSLGENDLTGPIPPELGNLANLESLSLHENDLTGPIPPKLGNLANLWRLNLSANRLTGPIPRELGDLTNLGYLYAGRNDLTGRIPPELGGMADLRRLNLAANRLTGPIPPELGGLAALSILYLGENELTGPVPPEFGGLMRLRELALQGNADMSGVLPVSLINLPALETFQTTGTALCAPSGGFLEWLQGVPNRRVSPCEGEPAVAYLVQAVQSREFPVPLVGGEEALLRVFVTASRDNDERLPPVRASFYLSGTLAHVADIPGGPGPIPTEVDEGSLATSANAVVPADVVLPGLEMVVEVDPDGTLEPALGVARRIPATGRAAIDVQAMPLIDLTVVPFLWTAEPDLAVLEAVSGMAADPEGHALLADAHILLPLDELTVTAHEPVMSSSNDAYDLLDQTKAILVMEGGTGYYMGTLSGARTGAGGLAGSGSLALFARLEASTIAHEFGHKFSLSHAPGRGNPDPAFPYSDGSIGVWGYDSRERQLVPPDVGDLMGPRTANYADRGLQSPRWVSDYHFTKALHFRLFDDHQASLTAQQAESLLLWGGADADGELYLNPAFVVDAPPALPGSRGEYLLAGRAANGRELFALRFGMPETTDGDGSSSFVFTLPVRPEWAAQLASITLSGPGGFVTLDGESDRTMTILRDPRSGQVRGILRDLPPAAVASYEVAADAIAGEPGFEALFSRGIPGPDAWRR